MPYNLPLYYLKRIIILYQISSFSFQTPPEARITVSGFLFFLIKRQTVTKVLINQRNGPILLIGSCSVLIDLNDTPKLVHRSIKLSRLIVPFAANLYVYHFRRLLAGKSLSQMVRPLFGVCR